MPHTLHPTHDQKSSPCPAEQAPRSHRDNASALQDRTRHKCHGSLWQITTLSTVADTTHAPRAVKLLRARLQTRPSLGLRPEGTTSCSKNSKRAKATTRSQWPVKRIPMEPQRGPTPVVTGLHARGYT
ncbi:hypothetical protein JG687_00006998 [Phytophthora cactorum]|uniref:Uncharacterized protein n=1 Tax=Phytophthora cactorum TaxID=29920 RepID=A0A8T1UGU3_9STRA|nr:hypothetical protein JG687_00006998 [Phytophthora cactorum]